MYKKSLYKVKKTCYMYTYKKTKHLHIFIQIFTVVYKYTIKNLIQLEILNNMKLPFDISLIHIFIYSKLLIDCKMARTFHIVNTNH